MNPDGQRSLLVSTDPPYYHNIGYADLSDYFYVWLPKSIKSVFHALYSSATVPKAEKLVATPYRHDGKPATDLPAALPAAHPE